MLEFDFSLVSDSFPLLVKGALVTIEITALSVSSAWSSACSPR